MSANTFTLLMVAAAVIVLIMLVLWSRHERDTIRAQADCDLGRELRAAAGSESAARMAIESANLDRLLEQKYRAPKPRLPANVVRMAPRVVQRGRPLHFEPTDGAA